MLRRISILSVVLIAFLMVSCAEMTSPIPSDPVGISEPASWGEDVQLSLTVLKEPGLVPIDVPDAVRVKVSFMGYSPSAELTTDNFMVFEDGKAQGFTLEKEGALRSGVDIVFLVDVTGSMWQEIEGVKNSITNFLDYLKEEGYDVKIAVVPFGDYVPASPTSTDEIGFDPPWLDLSDITTASSYVESLDVGYGSDTPENSFGAILFAWENVSWRAGSQKIMILLTDARSHYAGDGADGYFYPSTTKEEILGAIKGYVTLYMVASTDYDYFESDTDFSSPDDPREIAVETGGFVIYQDPYGEVDLTEIGIAESIVNSYIITFESDSPEGTHTISVYYEGPDGERGWAETEAQY